MTRVDPTQIPLFAGLPRVALARLVPELETAVYSQGEQLPLPDADIVYLLAGGQIACNSAETDQGVPILTLGPGDIITHPTQDQVASRLRYQCATEVQVVRIARSRLDALSKQYPMISTTIQGQLNSRLAQTQLELLRTRRLLGTYARELWSSVPSEECSASTMASSAKAAPTPVKITKATGTAARDPKARPVRPAWVTLLVNLVTLLGIWIVLPHSSNAAHLLLGVFVWAGVNWALATLPDHVIALASAFASLILGLVTFPSAFSGFASGSWWVLLAVLGVVVAVSRTGLLYRIALAMLKFLPPTYWWQSLALLLTGLAITPAVPNGNARISILGPLATELSDAMQLPPHSKGSAGLAMATYLGAGQAYFIFLNGAPMTIILWSILSPDVKAYVNWGSWALAGLPMGITLIAGFMALLFIFFQPESAKPISRETVALQQAVLGKVTRQEWLLAIVVTVLLFGFITEPIHGISSEWVAVGIFLFLMGSHLLDKEGLKQIDWSLTLYMGAVIGLSTIAQKVGLIETLTSLIAPWVMELNLSATVFLLGVAVLTILFRLAVPPPVVTVVLTVALEPVARVLLVSPFAVGLVVVAFCSSWVVPQQWSVYLSLVTATNERSFSHHQVKGLAWANNILLILGLLAGIPLWRSMGLMP